jgi:hypothetical protein
VLSVLHGVRLQDLPLRSASELSFVLHVAAGGEIHPLKVSVLQQQWSEWDSPATC